MVQNYSLRPYVFAITILMGFHTIGSGQDIIYQPVSIGRLIDQNHVRNTLIEDPAKIFIPDEEGFASLHDDIREALEQERDHWLQQYRKSYMEQFAANPVFREDTGNLLQVILDSFTSETIRVRILFPFGHSRWHHYLVCLRDYTMSRNEMTNDLFQIKRLEETYAFSFRGVGYGMTLEEMIGILGPRYLEKIQQPLQYQVLYYPEDNLEVVLQDGRVKYLNPVKPNWVLEVQQQEAGIPLFTLYPYDNGPDYPSEGLIRIVGNEKIGYANLEGIIVIPPVFEGAMPFREGFAKICEGGKLVKEGEYHFWKDARWGLIDTTGTVVVEPFDAGLLTHDLLDWTCTVLKKFNRELKVKVRSIKPADHDFLLYTEKKGVIIDLALEESEKPLLSCLFLPWQNMTFRPSPEDTAMFPRENLLTVTPTSIVYVIDWRSELPDGKNEHFQNLNYLINKTLNTEEDQRTVKPEDGYSIQNDLRILYSEEHTCYVEISVAVPGSGTIFPDAMRTAFPGKMVLVHEVPDKRAVHSRWIAPVNPVQESQQSNQ